MNIIATLGWALAIAATFTAMPQLIHLAKGNRVGIEPLTPTIACVTMVSWIIFTAAKQDLPAFASSLGPLIIWAITLALLSYHKVPNWKLALILALSLTLALSIFRFFSIIPISLFGTLSAIGSILWGIPQFIKVLRHRKIDLSGVSSLAYLLLALEGAAWILYSIGTGIIQYALAPTVQLPLFIAIAYYSWESKRKIKNSFL